MQGFTATYINANSFSLVGDMTTEFSADRRTKANCGSDGYKYGTIASSSYSSPNTTVVINASGDDLTDKLVRVFYGEQSSGNTGTIPTHLHDGTEGEGGDIDASAHDIADHGDTSATGTELDTLTDNSIANTLHRHSELVASDGSPDPALSIGTTGTIATNGSAIELNSLGSGNRFAYIDFVGDDAYTDYGLRIIRSNTGENTNTGFYHRGTGDLNIITQEAAPIIFKTTNATRLTIAADGNITQPAGKYIATDEIRAVDGGGLLLRDDSGTLGVTIADGGKVSLASGTGVNEFSTDGTLAGDSDDAVPTEKAVATAINTKSDNILINQDFSIWQENTNFTNPANDAYTADGYFIGKADGDGTAPHVNIKKNVVAMETGFEQCMEMEITNVGVQGTNVSYRFQHTVEDYKKYIGKTVTCSFRVKASTAITLSTGNLMLYDGVGSTVTSVPSITTSWVTYSATLAVDAAPGRLEVRFQLIPTGAGTISTTGSIYVQWMKLELGSTATPIVPRNTGDELRLCQRYYQKSYLQTIFPGVATINGAENMRMTGLTDSDHVIHKSVQLPVVMKAAPTVTLYDVAGASGKVTMLAGSGIAGTVAYVNEDTFTVYGTNGAAGTERLLRFHYTAVSRV